MRKGARGQGVNVILGYPQIWQRNNELPSKMCDEIEAVQNSGNYLLALINDILDLSKIEAGRMELDEINFDHQGLIKELSAMLEIRWQKKDSLGKSMAWVKNRFGFTGMEESSSRS
ncbi:hypothetical protein IH992_07345 [Candidatus Poribacteria bacterium]|nr:hypothetical protein [Candidatus Poribacteria bacterium]